MDRRVTLFSATLGEDRKIEPPLGPLYIASALENAGWSVDFRDYQLFAGANPFDPGAIVECLRDHAPVVMISCFVDMLPVVLAAAERIKANEPATYILLGGPGPTAGAADFLQTYPSLDAIVMGEGEETIKEWSDACAAPAGSPFAGGRPIAGMVYRTPYGIAEGGPRKRIAELPSSMIRPTICWTGRTIPRDASSPRGDAPIDVRSATWRPCGGARLYTAMWRARWRR